MSPETLQPGQTIGILGGGQLSRMLVLAAAELGFKSHIFCPETDAPASFIADCATRADYRDAPALAGFAAGVDVITYEFENIPIETLTLIGSDTVIYPSQKALDVAQDRLREKIFIRNLGIAVTDFTAIDNSRMLGEALTETLAEALDETLTALGGQGILKTRRFGYDGKGQWRLDRDTDLQVVAEQLGNRPAILEALVDFECEASILVARNSEGRMCCYPVIENHHENHILRHSTLPARLSPENARAAQQLAEQLADALDYVGVLAIELFVTRAGLLVNEIAPRVHNSGHLTQDACHVGQFEQHIRAISGWPLGDASAHSHARMTNLLGDEIHDWRIWAAKPECSLHLYDKGTPRAGRKMGHVIELIAKSGAKDTAQT